MGFVLDALVLLVKVVAFFAQIALVLGIVVAFFHFLRVTIEFVAVTWDWARLRKLRKPFWMALGDALLAFGILIMLIMCLVGVDVIFTGLGS